MVEGKRKSRSVRRVSTRLPSGKVVVHFKPRKPSHAQCANCGDKLKGVPRTFTNKLRNMPKSHRRPERPYGGVLCSRCSRQVIVDRVRGLLLEK